MNPATRILVSVVLMLPGAAANAAELDWMAGHWCGLRGKTFNEETWLPARGDLMIGGSTDYDADPTSLQAIQATWLSHDTIDNRIAALQAGAAPNPFLDPSACRAYAERARGRLQARLDREAS